MAEIYFTDTVKVSQIQGGFENHLCESQPLPNKVKSLKSKL